MSNFSKLVSSFVLFLATFGFSSTIGCSTEESVDQDDEHVGTADQALTAEQCEYFDINGTIQICHALGNGKFKILKLNEQACVNAHGAHATDYVTSTDPNSPLYDPTCQGNGCLPEGAPCDTTLPCCDGSSCSNGHCAPALPPAILSFAVASDSYQVDKATWAQDNGVGADEVNDAVTDLVVRGNVKAISVLRAYSDGTCWQTTQWDTIIGNTSLLPDMSCGNYAIGSHTYGIAVSADGGATMLNGATGEMPLLGNGTHSLKLYIPYMVQGAYYRARVQLQDNTMLESDVLAYAVDPSSCTSSQTFCDVSCADLDWDPSNCGACGHQCAPAAPGFAPSCYVGDCYYY